MDGYAVIAADVANASKENPVTLTVIDDVPAGFRATEVVTSGNCIRIMTGAPMPDGADCVVPVENTDGGVSEVVITQGSEAGAYIRRIGEDVLVGDEVMRAGTLISARHLAVIAAVGRGTLKVIPKPRVAVISTGSELVEPGTKLNKGLISDSNSFLLVAAATEAGAQAYRVPPVQDDAEAFRTAVFDQLHRADLILTSGGVSMGAYDTVKEVFTELGTVQFLKVAMQPGMPQGHGHVGEDKVPIITLPGNPVSSFISFQNFVRPAIARLRGLEAAARPTVRVTIDAAMTSPLNKRQFARGKFVGANVVTPVGAGQGSHVVGGLAASDCLIVIPEGIDNVAAGSLVDVVDLRGDIQ
jgi:molybdopterin molybdotransferase